MTDKPLAALVLVGGYGTRLRPLTFTRSKPLVDFCNKPMCEYMLDALVNVGCEKIILALSVLQNDLADYIKEYSSRHPNVQVIPSVETVAMGTAGPIALAKEHLKGHRFFMLNSDVISPYPFKELLEYHIKKGGEATIMGWRVEDGSRFGVIDSTEDGQVQGFREKPAENNKNCQINAGHYILEPSVIDRVPNEPCSIERKIFPEIARDKKLYVMELEGYWMDIGTPSAFIDGIPLLIRNEKKVLVDPTAVVDPSAVLEECVIVGPNCRIGPNCHLSHCVIMAGSTIGDSSVIKQSIVGWLSRVGKDCVIEEMTVLGENVNVESGTHLSNFLVCPHRGVNNSLAQPQRVLI